MHADTEERFEDTPVYRAVNLVHDLLKAHVGMVKRPIEFSTDNAVKQHYYGLLNKTVELVRLGLEKEAEDEHN